MRRAAPSLPSLRVPSAPGIHDSWRHLSLPWLAQCKPSGPAQACTGQDRARIDGVRSRVYLAPNCMLYITIHQSVNQSRPHSLSSLVTSAMECSMTGVRVQTRTVFVVTPGPISAPFIFRSGCMAFRWRGEGRTFLRSTSMINNLCFWFDGSGPPAKKALRAAQIQLFVTQNTDNTNTREVKMSVRAARLSALAWLGKC